MHGAADADSYLEAFMNGFEFTLLAIRGRLAESDLGPEERARLEAFLDDYARIVRAYKERRPEEPRAGLVLHGILPVEMLPTMGN